MLYSHEAAQLIARQADARTIRRELSPATVLWRWGRRQPERRSGLRLHYLNPFRDDHDP